MNEAEFDAAAGATLDALEQALDAAGIDCERKPGGVLELEFDDGSKVIVNRHGAAREIWVAARSGGFHYRLEGDVWRDTRSGAELFEALSSLVSGPLGRRVSLRR
jgi:CyaY protein